MINVFSTWLFSSLLILMISINSFGQTDISPFDPRDCGNPCVSNDLSIDSIYVATLDTMPFDPLSCGAANKDTMLLACFTIANNTGSDRGAVFMAVDIIIDNILDQTLLVCFPGILPQNSKKEFCVEFNYKCGTTVEIRPGYVGWRAANNGGDQCPGARSCKPSGLHPPGKCIGYFSAEVICMDNGMLTTENCDMCISQDNTDTDMDNIPDDCDDCIVGAACDSSGFAGLLELNLGVCECRTGACMGTIDADGDGVCAKLDCKDTGRQADRIGKKGFPCWLSGDGNPNDPANWTGIANDNCECVGNFCAAGDLSSVNAPVANIVNSSCGSGGVIQDPVSGTCPPGSTLEFSQDSMTWTFDVMELTYNQTTQDTIYTRCTCNSNLSSFGPVTAIVTAPGPCPPAMGACCIAGTCSTMTQADCLAMSGEYEGDGTPSCTGCMPPVLPTGSCFNPSTGECNSGVTAMDCASGGGVYQGDNTTACVNVPAVPTLTQWGVIILGFLLLILGVLAAKDFSIKGQ